MALQDSQQADSAMSEIMQQLSERFDITEPFTRIVEALVEAHPIIKAAA